MELMSFQMSVGGMINNFHRVFDCLCYLGYSCYFFLLLNINDECVDERLVYLTILDSSFL